MDSGRGNSKDAKCRTKAIKTKKNVLILLQLHINTYEIFYYLKGRRYDNDDDDIRGVSEGWQKMRDKLGWPLRPY